MLCGLYCTFLSMLFCTYCFVSVDPVKCPLEDVIYVPCGFVMQRMGIAERFNKGVLELSGITEAMGSILLEVCNPFIKAYMLSSCTFQQE